MKTIILHKNYQKISNLFFNHKENEKIDYSKTNDQKEVELIISGSTTNLNTEELQKYPNLKFIINCCNGINNIDSNYCKEKNIQIFNAPTANINSTAEHTTALILTAIRKVLEADASVRKELWERERFYSKEINECTIGFIGFGRIARLVFEKLESFEPKTVLAFDPYLSKEQMNDAIKDLNKNNNPSYVKKVELDELLKTSDIISLHLPLLETTFHMIAKEQFDIMKNDTLIVNCSRGGIIDEDALINFLTKNQNATAALDVFEGEPNVNPKLFKLSNIVLTPHIASMSKKAQDRMITEAKENFEKSF